MGRGSAVVGVFLLCSALLIGGGKAGAMGFFDHPMTGKAAPSVRLQRLDGAEVDMVARIKDKPGIFFFWTTWCPHCREQIKALNAKRAQIEKKGIVVEFIDVGEDKETVEQFLAGQKIADINVLLDYHTAASEIYAVYGVPSMYFIGPDGIIRDVQNTLPDNYEAILKKKLK
jgi:peroxiredoxin